MKAWVAAAIGGPTLFFGGGWYLGSPWITLYNIRAAIEHRDIDAMISYVDFDALRQNLKDQVRANAPPSTPKTDASGWSLPAPATNLALMEQQIDLYVTPETARAMFFRAGGGSSRSFDTPARIGGVGEMARDIAVERKGLGTFIVRGKTQREGLGFVFTSHGLGWKLSGVTLPASMVQSMGKRPTAW